MNVKYVRVVFTPIDYANAVSAQCCLRSAIGRSGFPIKVAVRGEDTYLIRTDMEEE